MAKFKAVRRAMQDRHLTYGKLSKITGFSVGRMCGAVNGRPASDKVRRSMAMALEMSYEALWTERAD